MAHQNSNALNKPYNLKDVTRSSYEKRAERESSFVFGAISTTDVCNLECVMCHFNGPNAIKKNNALKPEAVYRIIDELPTGSNLFLSSGGDLFMDPHAEEYIAYASRRGLTPIIQSHGQLYSPERLDRLLTMGVRQFRMSVDAIEAVQYEKIRRGGKFQNILDTVDHLNLRRGRHRDIAITINVTMFRKTFDLQDKFIEFWTGKVDTVAFNAEYYDTWNFRNTFTQPQKRVNCKISTLIQPSGKITPCAAIGVHCHENELDWLPTVDSHGLQDAYDYLCDLYDDPNSPLSKLCAGCDWWILYDQQEGQSPYYRQVDLPKPKPRKIGVKKRVEGLLNLAFSRLGIKHASN